MKMHHVAMCKQAFCVLWHTHYNSLYLTYINFHDSFIGHKYTASFVAQMSQTAGDLIIS